LTGSAGGRKMGAAQVVGSGAAIMLGPWLVYFGVLAIVAIATAVATYFFLTL
jgi:hypothetical protein